MLFVLSFLKTEGKVMLRKKKVKNAFRLYFNFFLFIGKAILTLIICFSLQLVPTFKAEWLWLVWVTVSIAIDIFLLLKKPNFFTKTELIEEKTKKYGFDTRKLNKYLSFSSKIRLARTIGTVFFVWVFSSPIEWIDNLPAALIFAFFIFDPLARWYFDVKIPYSFKIATKTATLNNENDFLQTPRSLHKHDPSFYGSDSWNAVHRTNDLKPPKIL
jgi:hypothetical protein